MKLSDYVAGFLVEQGIRHVFAVSGLLNKFQENILQIYISTALIRLRAYQSQKLIAAPFFGQKVAMLRHMILLLLILKAMV